MKRGISILLAAALLLGLLPITPQTYATDATRPFVDGVYVLALKADENSALDMAMLDNSTSLLQLNHATGEASQQFVIRQYSKDSQYYMIQSMHNQGYLGYNGRDSLKKVQIKKYGQLDDNAAEYLWKPIANDDGSWSFAPKNAYAAENASFWNLRLGVTATDRADIGSTAALVAADANQAMQRWILLPCDVLQTDEEKTFQIQISQDFSGKHYSTDNVGGTIRGAWDQLPANISEWNAGSSSQNFLFEWMGKGYSIRECSNSEYLTVGTNGKLVLCNQLTDAGYWMVFPNWSQNNQHEAAIADTYSLVSCLNGHYYAVQMQASDFGKINTDDVLYAKSYQYNESQPFQQYWKLAEGRRNAGTVTLQEQAGEFQPNCLTLPIQLLDYSSDNMLFEYDNYWPSSWPYDLAIEKINWIKGTNPQFGQSASGSLLEKKLVDGYPVYTQKAVEDFAVLLKEKLGIQYMDNDWSVNNTFLKGETHGRYGDGKDLAQWLREKLGSGLPLGNYEETATKRASLIADWNRAKGSITTCMDAAYFLLNSLYTSGSYNERQPYTSLKLGRVKDSAGQDIYVFDSAFADENGNSSVAYADGTISNTSAATKPLYNGKEKYPFLPIVDKNNKAGMTRYESPIYESLRSLAQYGDTYFCRNYSYALSCNSRFVYEQAKGQFFEFSGNDDAYLFINSQLVAQLSGGHSASTKTERFELDSLNLEDGKVYDIDFFYLQRMGPDANLRIATNIPVGKLTSVSDRTVVLNYDRPVTIDLTEEAGGGNVQLSAGSADQWEDSFTFANGTRADVQGQTIVVTPGKADHTEQALFYRIGNGSVHRIAIKPANSVYYEEGNEMFTYASGQFGKWQDTSAGSIATAQHLAEKTEDEDENYKNCTTYSAGTAKMTVVSEAEVDPSSKQPYPTVQFTFWGTGFDLISRSSTDSGIFTVLIKDADGNRVASNFFDTFYGTYFDPVTGKWSANKDSTAAVHQAPVASYEGLDYGQYTVTVTAVYATVFDYAKKGSFTAVVDGVRIFNPLGLETDQLDYQKKTIHEVLSAAADDDANLYIDGKGEVGVMDALQYGPSYEVHLAANQSIALEVTAEKDAVLKIGARAFEGEGNGQLTAYEVVNGVQEIRKQISLNTATLMHYDCGTTWNEAGKKLLVFTNSSDKLIALTDLSMQGVSGVQCTREVVERAARSPIAVDVFSQFTDLNKDAWYYDSVKNVVNRGIMNGVAKDRFNPNGNLTRAMAVKVLYELAGHPEVERNHSFTDVKDSAWYADAVAWGFESGVVKGISETKFAPNDTLTREQMVTFLYRYAGGGKAADQLGQFTDAEQISNFAKDAMNWAIENQIIKGTGKGKLSPRGTASRAQIAAIIARSEAVNPAEAQGGDL